MVANHCDHSQLYLALCLQASLLLSLACLVAFIAYLSVPHHGDHAHERRKMLGGVREEIPPTIHHREAYFTSRDGQRLFTQVYGPADGNFTAVIFACHGFGDTCQFTQRRHHLEYARRGFKVVALDLPGHGWSDGLWAAVPSFDQLVATVYEFFQFHRESADNNHLPHFLMGESMGGAVVLQILNNHGQEQWRGAFLLAPMCKISDNMKPPEWVVSVLRGLARWFPALPAIPGKDILDEAIKNPEVRRISRSQPLGYGPRKARLSTGLELLRVTERIEETMEQLTVPLLIIHGDSDKVTDPESSQSLYKRASSADKRLHLEPGMWHAFHGEPADVQGKLWDMVSEWMSHRSSSRSTRPRTDPASDNRHDMQAADPRPQKSGFKEGSRRSGRRRGNDNVLRRTTRSMRSQAAGRSMAK